MMGKTISQSAIPMTRRVVGDNIWLSHSADEQGRLDALARLMVWDIRPEVLESEQAVGQAMLAELEAVARAKDGDIVMILLGGRGAQALHRLLGARARAAKGDQLIARLHVFTQDALAPMQLSNSLSFVRDFERLLGEAFFEQVKSFTTMRTDAPDLEAELTGYVQKLEALGGADIFFLGHGPEPNDASHLAYIKPGSGATAADVAGLIPISSSILEHHITKFKAGGSAVNAEDEAECRRATHILTLGPAAILSAKRIVQSIVDAATAPAKRKTYRRVLETKIADDPAERARQLEANPGLWVRMHPNVRSLVLPDVLVGKSEIRSTKSETNSND
jgi:6-phosphogluconolactonase/glucosamine-6-phosphate isomerase/deaminase